MKKAKRILEISTAEIERVTVSIDGKAYELRDHNEFGIAEFQKQARDGRRLDALMNKPEAVTAEEERELAELLDGICRQVLDAPDAVHAKLRDTSRLAIVRAFAEQIGPAAQ